MRKFIKLLPVMMCMIMILALGVSIKAEAANVTTGKLEDYEKITWTYDADTKTLTITGEANGLKGDRKKSRFLSIAEDIETIIVKGCTLKGSVEYMFANLNSLKSVQFQNVNTSDVNNMNNMFYGCTSLKSVDLSNFETGNVTNMQSMFGDCSSLTDLDLSNFNTGNVTNMQSMFSDCSSLTDLDLSNFNTGNVINMQSMFNDCTSLTDLDLSNFNTGNVTNMQSMFSGCSSLSDLDLSNFETGNVTNMGGMFFWCRNLKSVDMSSFQTENVKKMANLFYDCRNLKTVDLSNFDTRNVTDMNSMFFWCTSLESVDVSNFDTGNVTNMHSMFDNCRNLTSLDVSNFDTGNVTDMSMMFQYCTSLSSLDLSNFDTGNVTTMRFMLQESKGLKSLDLSNFDLGKVTDTYDMLDSVSKLGVIKTPKVIPETISIDLPASRTYYNLEGERVSELTKDSCGITLLDKDYRVSSISLNVSSLTVRLGSTEQLTEKVYPNNAAIKAVTWKSSDTEVAKVDANGKVTPVALGTATITATATDGTGKTASCEVTVIRPVNGITLNQTSMDLDKGDTYTLTTAVNPENASDKSVTWKSSNTVTATVDANGKVTAKNGGTATITATANDGSGVSASCEVTVIEPVTYLYIASSTTMKLYESYALTVRTNQYATNKEMYWTSSDSSVVTVDANGMLTAVGVGNAVITVTAKDGSGMTATCNVRVIIPIEQILLNKTELQIIKGCTYTLASTIIPSNATIQDVVWYSQYPEIATVDVNTGKVTAVETGTTTIIVLAKDESGKHALCTITVKDGNPFADVEENSWQYPYVKFVYDHKIMTGKGYTEDGKIIFEPDNYMTRAEFVQSLYNKEGKPSVIYEATFTDVPEGQWFTNAILWASKNGIAAGKGDRFDISGKITREEVATILYKYATNYKKYDTTGRASLDAYEDTDRISSWAVNNMKWAIHYGIMKGRGNILAPLENATRAECATMLKNFMDAYNE